MRLSKKQLKNTKTKMKNSLQLFKYNALRLHTSLLGITSEAEEKRNGLALAARKFKTVTSPNDQEKAVAAARDIRSYVKLVADAGKTFRKPLVDFSKQASTIEQEHLAPLLAEQERLEKLVVNFQQAEDRRVLKEEEDRQKQIQESEKERIRLEGIAQEAQENARGRKAQANAIQALEKADAAAEHSQALITAPLPEKVRASGVSIRKVLKWEVTDLNALVKARPDLCKIEPKASAINAVCVPEMPNLPPGLKLWWENEASVRKW